MANRTESFRFEVGGVLTDVTSVVVSDPTATYGIKRNDTDGVITAAGTALTHDGTGLYSITFAEPVVGLTYTVYFKYVYAGETYYYPRVVTSAGDTLTTLTRVKSHMGITSTTYDTELTNKLAAATAAIQAWCDNNFFSSTYTEYLSPRGAHYLNPTGSLQLGNRPITAVSRVATCRDYALCISNTSTTTNQRATVAVTSTGLTLTRVASGVATTSTLAFATYTTITTLAAAVTALANGWVGTVYTGYGSWPTAYLKYPAGAANALDGGADIAIWVDEPNYYDFNADTGLLLGTFPQGVGNIRVDYTAGYSTIPEDVQLAACIAVATWQRRGTRDTTLQSERIGDYSYTNATIPQLTASFLTDPTLESVRTLLAPYRLVPAL